MIQCRLDFWRLDFADLDQEKLPISIRILAGWWQKTCQWPMETKPRSTANNPQIPTQHLIQGKFIELVGYFNNQGKGCYLATAT